MAPPEGSCGSCFQSIAFIFGPEPRPDECKRRGEDADTSGGPPGPVCMPPGTISVPECQHRGTEKLRLLPNAASSSDYPAARHSQPDAPQQPLAAAQPRLPPPFPAQQPQPAHQLKPSGSGSFNQRWLAEQASASTASAAAVAAQGRVPSLVGVKVAREKSRAEKLPTATAAAAAATKTAVVDQDENNDFCPTCLEVYTGDNPKIWTGCAHHFHLQCILEWQMRKDTCPICETKITF